MLSITSYRLSSQGLVAKSWKFYMSAGFSGMYQPGLTESGNIAPLNNLNIGVDMNPGSFSIGGRWLYQDLGTFTLTINYPLRYRYTKNFFLSLEVGGLFRPDDSERLPEGHQFTEIYGLGIGYLFRLTEYNSIVLKGTFLMHKLSDSFGMIDLAFRRTLF